MKKKISKILIANRGEIAVRIIRTCRELGIKTVAVYSAVDTISPHVQMSNEAFLLGPGPSRESYLRMEKILEVAKISEVDAIHPGYGFLSENPDFAERVTEAGIIFIGPRPESMRAMGDKTEARKLMQKANVPVVPGTPAIKSIGDVKAFIETNDYPVLIKAAAGGGGKGMRVVRSDAELGPAFATAQSEAAASFGDDRIYVEKYLDSPRHVEFQILADKQGSVVHLGERECTIQRRHQKIIEESPSVFLDEDLRKKMGKMATGAARACAYENAGTIEFLMDSKRNFYFLEMNTRLQVEHPITELRTGIDLVAQQISIASGNPLSFSQDDITFRGHALECRISAEDPADDFLPSTGKIVHLKPAGGIGIREDRGIDEGGEVSVFYDPMIAKLIAWGQTREEMLGRMLRALREYEILGVKTNIPLCEFVLTHRDFCAGTIDTHFLQRHFTSDSLSLPDEEVMRTAAIVAVMTANGSKQHENGLRSNWNEWKNQRKDLLRDT